jgi:hypothetical protein
MFYDTITHSKAARGDLVSVMGAENVFYGADYPWNMGDYGAIPLIENLKGINVEEKANILDENSTKLFNIVTCDYKYL